MSIVLIHIQSYFVMYDIFYTLYVYLEPCICVKVAIVENILTLLVFI